MIALPQLWPHQLAALSAVELAMSAGLTAGLVVIPTGTGKTGLALSLGRRLGLPMLFLVNRDELVRQTVRSARRFWPEANVATVEAGASNWDEPDLETHRRPDLAVAMVPTLVNRLDGIDPERFGLIVADEAHCSVAPTWRKVLDHFKPGFLLGITATPQRLDGKGLSSRYGREPLYSYSLHQAIKDGRLAPPDCREVKTGTNLDDVASTKGEDGESDLSLRQLSTAVNTHQRNDLIVATWLAEAKGRRTLAFCVDVDHARDLAKAFCDAGVRCAAITGRMKPEERRFVLAEFAEGKYEVLTNCEVLTTGFDDPGISCVLMCRPTESRGLYIQMVGRGLRLCEGKADCLVIDFTDNARSHKLVSILDLLGKKKPLTDGGISPDRPEPKEPSFRQLELSLPALVSWRLEGVCPWPDVPSIEGYVPTASWHNDPASDGQLHCLAGFGLKVAPGLSKGEASYLIDRALEYEAAFPLPATAKQRRLLTEEGAWEEGMSKRQASRIIGMLKQQERQEQSA